MAATMKDVAALAGLSIGTVSNYITGRVTVSEEKKRRIEQAIEKLNYQINPAARTLKTNQHNVIGVLIPDFRNMFVVRVVSYMEELLQQQGYSMMVLSYHQSTEKQEERLRYLQTRVDGILYMPHEMTLATMQCLQSIQRGIPVVAFNEMARDVQCDHVLTDSARVVRQAVCALLDKGHTSIGMLAGPQYAYTSQQRYQAYRETLLERNIKPDETLVSFGDFSRSTGVMQCSELVRSHPEMTALFAVGYRMTLGALDALNAAGCREKVCVVGYDASDLNGIVRPEIGYVYQPYEEMAKASVELILKRIRKDMEGFPQTVELQAEICNLDVLPIR